MVAPRKAGVDWTAIELAWCSGQTSYALAKQWGLSKQSVDEMAQRNGWQRGGPVEESGERKGWLAVVERTFKAPAGAKDSPQIRAKILEHLSEGLPMRTASNLVGISEDTLARWRDADADFAALIEDSQAQFVRSRVNNITSAGDRGDWRADSFLLERHRASRGDFSPPAGQGTGGLTVNFNLQGPWEQKPQVTIDATPADESPNG